MWFINVANSIIYLKLTFIVEKRVVRCGYKNGHQKIEVFKENGLHTQHLVIIIYRFNSQHTLPPILLALNNNRSNRGHYRVSKIVDTYHITFMNLRKLLGMKFKLRITTNNNTNTLRRVHLQIYAWVLIGIFHVL